LFILTKKLFKEYLERILSNPQAAIFFSNGVCKLETKKKFSSKYLESEDKIVTYLQVQIEKGKKE